MTVSNPRRPRPSIQPTANFLTALIRRLDIGHTPPAEEENRTNVILEAEVDGACYQLVRATRQREPTIALSPREYEIVRLVAAGHPNKIIADILQISSFTVATYLRRVFAKFGVSSRAAMVAQFDQLALGTPQRNKQRGPSLTK